MILKAKNGGRFRGNSAPTNNWTLKRGYSVYTRILYCYNPFDLLLYLPGKIELMQREIHKWYSPRLNKDMEIAVYGHFGFALLLLPTAAADFLEYERFHLISALEPHISSGKVKVFSINSINSEAWLNNKMHPRHKAIRHQQFNAYVENEVIPFIRTHTSADTPIITSGASLGAEMEFQHGCGAAGEGLVGRPGEGHAEATCAKLGEVQLEHGVRESVFSSPGFNQRHDRHVGRL